MMYLVDFYKRNLIDQLSSFDELVLKCHAEFACFLPRYTILNEG
jgi:hypothetical protein